MPKHISDETKEKLTEEYNRCPTTLEQMATKYGISRPSVRKILSQYSVQVWAKEKLFSPNLNEKYFEKIDSHKKAYFLGLITTDGCVFWKNSRRAFLSITLKKSDRYVLEDFMHDICCRRKLVYSDRSDTFTATVTSSKVVLEPVFTINITSVTEYLYVIFLPLPLLIKHCIHNPYSNVWNVSSS